MSWRKHFSPVNTQGSMSPIGSSSDSRANPTRTNYSSYLPDVYSGHPNRLERYQQYDTMDSDSEVNAALDILAEFCTQLNDSNGTPFEISFKETATQTEVKVLRKYLQQWSRLNKFTTRIFKIVRNAFKYGDSFFIRDPETQQWLYIDPSKIDKIIVNESEGKTPEQYVIRDLNINLQNLTVTQIQPNNITGTPGGTNYMTAGAQQRGMVGSVPQAAGSRFTLNQNQHAIDAKHVIHLSMSEGLDNNFPFGNSLLESIFKVYKQKELLEDSIIIYRVQRAPERRVFYIDVGNMPSHLAMSFVERVKNEVNQRRIPSVTGGGTNVIDASYNPLCLDLNTKIPLLDGRTLQLSELISEFEQGKENWAYSCNPITGEIVPGVINWAGITRKNTETIKLTFDNGKELICTPDHKIPVFGKGFVEAQHLTVNDSLIAFNTRQEKIAPNSNEYEQVWDHSTKSWKWTHRVVGEFFRKIKKHQEFTYLTENANKLKAVIHHKDSNRYNNDPRNLTYMNKEDHILYNASQKKDFKKFGYSKLDRLLEKFGYKNWKSFVKEINNFNHRIVKIEKVSNRDTGTITIDGTERWHNYHTFAIESGIFVKNSINEDYFFPQTCLAMDQKVTLLDGRNLKLIDIIEEYNEGKENWAYTVNQKTFEIEPGKIVWAGKTRLNTQLVEVLLDNGEKIKVTPDHRFIMRDGSEVEAQFLKEHDSLMPLYLHDATTGKHQGANKYLKYTCNATGKKKWVHIMVCPKNKPGRETEIHHIDCNSLNNSPNNLVEMNTVEHRDLHKTLGTYYLINAWKDPVKRKNIENGIQRFHANATEKDKEMFKSRGKKNGSATWNNPISSIKCLEALEKNHKIVSANKTIRYDDNMCFRVIELYNQGYTSISKLTLVLRDDNKFQNFFRLANPNLLRDKNRPNKILPTDTTLVKIAKHLGYKGWSDFKENYQVNHKVVSITWLEEKEDTGDITIESISNSHNFALTAGVFIHNSEGRGSKVDLLPGGTNLGEIDDLRYFTNKLFRALRIPSSYLPTGPDDGGSSFNDGRVGTAYIQELRFNKYCERLQGLINEQFNTEFKLYLHDKGVNVDPSVFDVKFNPPQNFASYRQAEMDTARVSTYTSLAEIPYLSKRFSMKRFLGLSQEEITENETLWKEENLEDHKSASSASAELRSAGITSGGVSADMGNIEDAGIPPEGMEEGDLGASPMGGGGTPAPGGAQPGGQI